MTSHKPRIALVTLDYPPKKGGVARYLFNLVAASGGAISVFQPKLRAVFPRWWPMVGFMISLRGREFERLLVSHVLPCGTAALIARQFGGLPYGVLMHGLDLRLARRSFRKRFLLRRVLAGAQVVFANSQFVANEISQFAPSIKPVVVTPGVEAIVFPEHDAARQALGLSTEMYQLIAVARLVPRKGIDTLIAALALLPSHVRLTVIGDGPDRKRLERLAAKAQGRIRFITNASDEERNQWYAASNAFALPVRDEGDDIEGFGIVFLEAAMAGLPCIAGKSGGATEAVEDEVTGLLVEPDNPQAVADAVLRLVGDAEFRVRLGHAARSRVQSSFRWVDRWEAIRQGLGL